MAAVSAEDAENVVWSGCRVEGTPVCRVLQVQAQQGSVGVFDHGIDAGEVCAMTVGVLRQARKLLLRRPGCSAVRPDSGITKKNYGQTWAPIPSDTRLERHGVEQVSR